MAYERINVKTEREIHQIAFAKASCLRGINYFLIHGPLTWFALVFIYGIIFWILTGNVPSTFRFFMILIIGFISSCLVGISAFRIFKWQVRKWDQTLTENEMQRVQEELKTITQPFKQINTFAILFMIFSMVFRIIMKFLLHPAL
jgi:hypothetical protein